METGDRPQAVVIGAGPAGLMAAGELAAAGCAVIVAEARPSVGRKLLMAGKSGLNLTREEPFDDFVAAYGESGAWLRPMLAGFGPSEVQDWARGLGQDLFTGSTGRVFPKVMKASPLLRAWLARLDGAGMRPFWRWAGPVGRGWDRTAPGRRCWRRAGSIWRPSSRPMPGCGSSGRPIWRRCSGSR
jgi:predicted flavoprotein YhiN